MFWPPTWLQEGNALWIASSKTKHGIYWKILRVISAKMSMNISGLCFSFCISLSLKQYNVGSICPLSSLAIVVAWVWIGARPSDEKTGGLLAEDSDAGVALREVKLCNEGVEQTCKQLNRPKAVSKPLNFGCMSLLLLLYTGWFRNEISEPIGL